MKRLPAIAFCAVLAAGCSAGVSDAQVEAAIQACIANGQGKFSDKVSVSDPDPERRAARERAAKQAIAQVADIHRREVESMCRQAIPAQCARNPDACKSP
ncbi:MAG: hypothetical protein ACTHOH_14120 [Lysobacteraceae bacterium]